MATQNQPDWDALAGKFDLWLPHIAPVGEALLAALPINPGDKVLDVASGTGEPALTLAQRNPHAQVTGTDAAAGMVRAAQNKAKAERLENIEFVTMKAEQLDFEDASFDKILCRFGVMLFEDSLQGLKEMYRVLKPGGQFALAVWSSAETMTTMHWAYQVFKDRLAEEDHPALGKVTSLGEPGALEALLDEAGFKHHRVERKQFDYQFNNFEEYWEVIEASDIMKQQFDALPEGERDNVRDEVARFARDFHGDNGLVIPHEYLLASGNK
jgi:ubiquinone/menaquinone biosynthesis C-methylase UbiE